MGVDWYSCNKCGETFPDCGDYEYCDCGEHWCSLECAEADGYKRKYCKIGNDTEDECENGYCCECEHYVETSCKYCREEDFNDEVLLDYALSLLGLNREGLIKRYRK